jgi:hypothetical protein
VSTFDIDNIEDRTLTVYCGDVSISARFCCAIYMTVTGKPRVFQNWRTFTEHMIVKHVDEEDLVTVAKCLLPLYPPGYETRVAFSNSSLSTMQAMHRAIASLGIALHIPLVWKWSVTQQSSFVASPSFPVVQKGEAEFAKQFALFRCFLAMEQADGNVRFEAEDTTAVYWR